eukprot:Gb_24791 [translate_table: standard]
MAPSMASTKPGMFTVSFMATVYCACICLQVEAQGPKVPALIVFGDSTMDPGNNNQLNTPAKSNFPPYGRDFIDGRPTGRFSNGKISSDFIAEALGIKETIPAYLDAELKAQDLATGVSFASAGSGWDNMTAQSGSVLAVWQQIVYFKEYKSRLSAYVGEEKASNIIHEAIYYISAGNADFGISYFFNPGSIQTSRSMQFTVSQYQDYLIENGVRYLKDLYNLGARRMLVAGISLLGCSPSERTFLAFLGRPCNDAINEAAFGFNKKWEPTLGRLQRSLPGLRLVYSDSFSIVEDAIQNPYKYGFEVINRGCCGTGLTEMGQQCNQSARFSCTDASKFVFWDAVHPTQRMSEVVANRVMNLDIPKLLLP